MSNKIDPVLVIQKCFKLQAAVCLSKAPSLSLASSTTDGTNPSTLCASYRLILVKTAPQTAQIDKRIIACLFHPVRLVNLVIERTMTIAQSVTSGVINFKNHIPLLLMTNEHKG